MMKKLLLASALMLSAVSLNAKLSPTDAEAIRGLRDGLRDDKSALADQVRPILDNYLAGLNKLLTEAVANGSLTQQAVDDFRLSLAQWRQGAPIRDALVKLLQQ